MLELFCWPFTICSGGGRSLSCFYHKLYIRGSYYMKRSLLIAALLVLGLAACGKKEQPEPAMAPAPAAAPAPAPAPAAEMAKPAEAAMAEEKKPEEEK
ncbi:MAG: hypothetical protein ACREU0_10475 [Burkholderiales bacterium]